MEATQDTGAEVTTAPESAELPKDATPGAPQPQEKKKYKLKVYENEEEYDEDEVLKMAQKVRAADFKFQKAAELDKARAAWLESVKGNPWDVFDKLGLDADELAERRLAEKLRLQMMSPEQKEAYEAKLERDRLKKQLEETERARKEEKESLEKDEYERLKSQYAQELDSNLPKVFKELGIAATPRRIARAIEFIEAHASTHGKVPDFKQAISMAEKDLEKDFEEFLPKMSVDQLMKMLPREVRDAIRKYELDELKQQNPLRTKDRPTATPQKRVSKAVRMSSDEWFEKNLARFK